MPGSTWLDRWRERRTAYWRSRLGVDDLQAELLLYKHYLHEGVVAEPGRSILKVWRQQALEQNGPPREEDVVAMKEYTFSLR